MSPTATRPAPCATVVLPAGVLLSTFVAAMVTQSGARLGLPALCGLAGGSIVVATSGYVIARSIGLSRALLALAILLGSIATSLFLMIGCLASGEAAATVFLWWSALVTAALALPAMRGTGTSDVVSPKRLDAGFDLRDAASISAIVLVVGMWCHRAARMLPTLLDTGVAPFWSDYFIHGTMIAQFAAGAGAVHSSFLMVDQPIIFYHYASYPLVAALARLVDLPSLGLATSVHLPYGILLTALGIYAFVTTLRSEVTGVCVVMALLLLPDASSVLRNGFFGFHWLLFTVPGSGYGLGVAFTALTLLARWQAEHRKALFWAFLIVTASIFMFRAHIFILFAPALVMTAFCETDLARRNPGLTATALLIAAATTAGIVTAIPAAREAWMHFSVFGPFLEAVHTWMSPTAYDGIYQMLVQDYGQVSAQIVGFLALVPVALGGLTILMPTALIAATRRAGWQWFDSFPVWCMAGWLGLVLFAPRPAHGDPTEYQHRSVVLVYAAAFVWTWLWLDRAWQVRAVIRPHSRFLHAVPVLALMAFGTLLVSSWNHDPSRPIFSRGVLHYGIRVDRGLIDAAAYVRIHAVDGDCFALVPSDPDALMDDAATRLSVLSDTPAFLARPGIQVLNGRDRRAAVEERLAALKEVETTADSGAAFRALRKWHVRFLVALGTRGPLFDPDGSHAAFRTDVARVYRIEPEVASGQASQ